MQVTPVTIKLPETDSISIDDHELDFRKRISDYRKIIVLSPHLDDAILSTGSVLTHYADIQKSITIINIFTQGSTLRSAATDRLLTKAGIGSPDDYFIQRKTEDAQAFGQLGNCQITNLDYTDAAWRLNGKDNALYNTVFDARDPQDSVLVERLTTELSNYIEQNETLVFAPLGRGRHIDHLIVRDVAQQLQADVIYYTDFPYALTYEQEFDFIADHSLKATVWHGSYTVKAELLLRYTSQYTSLFKQGSLQLINETYFTP